MRLSSTIDSGLLLSRLTTTLPLLETTTTSSLRVNSSFATTACTLYFCKAFVAFSSKIFESVSSLNDMQKAFGAQFDLKIESILGT